MKLSTIFHCPGDMRVNVGSDSVMMSDEKSVSYVSWTDATEDRDNPNSCIRTTARQNLDTLPWLSDGNPVKGQSVTDLATFRKMVMPALERHDSAIVVTYASGAIKAVKVEDDENVDAEVLFKRIAPSLANKKATEEDSEDSEEEEDEDSEEE